MKLLNCLFIHDHIFKKHAEHVYSEGKITNVVFKRYILDSDKLIVYSRMVQTNQPEKLTLIDLPNVQFRPVKGKSFFDIFSRNMFFTLRRAIKELNHSDFLVVRLPSFLGIFILCINLIYRKKYFLEFVGDPEEALLTSRSNVSKFFKFFVLILSYLNTFFVKNADGVIYVTKYALQKKYPTSSSLKTYASNVEVNVKDRFLGVENFKIKNDFFKIGLIGSFNNSYKGIDVAIRAIKILKEKNKKVHLHILGSGKLHSTYLDLAQELDLDHDIHFDGVLAGGGAVSNWLESMDLYIQPSRSEGLPRSLIEAMAVGKPAIATNVGGIPELLDQEYLVEPDNPEQLAAKILNFIDDQNLRFYQGRINFEKAKEYDSNVLKKRRDDFWTQARNIVIQDMK